MVKKKKRPSLRVGKLVRQNSANNQARAPDEGVAKEWQGPSKSKERLEQVMKSMQAREKTKKPAAHRKQPSAWSSFYHEELLLMSLSKQPFLLPPHPQFQQPLKEASLLNSENEWDEFDEPELINVQVPTTDDTDKEKAAFPTVWHKAISNKDWDTIEMLLISYDHMQYSGQKPEQLSQTSMRRSFKTHLSFNSISEDSVDGLSSTGSLTAGKQIPTTPLLKVDSAGRTPLHLACIEQMPSKLCQQLFSTEKSASLMRDRDARLPIHLAAIYHPDRGVLDRLLRSNPSILATADSFERTPLMYAILQAEEKREKKLFGATWKCPLTQQQSDWQTQQNENWQNVQLILDNMTRRRKLLSSKYEESLLLASVQFLAPPAVVDTMLAVAEKVLRQNAALGIDLILLLCRYHYPVATFEKALEICGYPLAAPRLVSTMQKGLMHLYGEGCIEFHRKTPATTLSFRTELLDSYNVVSSVHGNACQEWWEKLKFFIWVSSGLAHAIGTKEELRDDELIHCALTIPDIPPSLLELLIQIAPHSRYTREQATGTMPIHLACRHIQYESIGKSLKVFKLLLWGDPAMCRTQYRHRSPLQLAVLAHRPLPVIQAILALDKDSAGQRDPFTRLFPFQLAALDLTLQPFKSHAAFGSTTPYTNLSSKKAVWGTLDSTFELLKAFPAAVGPPSFCGSGKPNSDVGPLAQHVLNWFFSYSTESGWSLNKERAHITHEVSGSGCLKQEPLELWWNKARQLIWQLCRIRSRRKKMRYDLGDDKYLLHATLSNGGTPPIVVKLILTLFSNAVQTPIPGTDQYPIHLAARSSSYVPLHFEEGVSMDSALALVAAANPALIRCKSNGKTPLQLAICSGKTWQEIRTMVCYDPKCLLIQDSATGLYPFQQTASKESYTRSYRLVRSLIATRKWFENSADEKSLILLNLRAKYQLDKLTSIFEMLRAMPDVLDAKTDNA